MIHPLIQEPVLQTALQKHSTCGYTVYSMYSHRWRLGNYSLYDKETKKLMDGGVIESAAIEESPVSSVAGAVRTEVFAIQGMTPTKVTFEDITLVDELQVHSNGGTDVEKRIRSYDHYFVDELSERYRGKPVQAPDMDMYPIRPFPSKNECLRVYR